MRWAFQRLKKQQGGKFDETWVLYIPMQKKQKIKKFNDEKGGDKQKKQESWSTIKNKTHFSLLVFDCDFEDALLILISLN